MSDETTLLPCPFCGGVDTLKVAKPNVRNATPDNYLVLCCLLDGGCGASSGTRRTEAEAIAAWNTRAAHGTLTAKQVRKAIERHIEFYDGGDYDEQAIADDLNFELGSGTCELREASWDDGTCTWGVICSACGEKHEHTHGLGWNFAPCCGRKVER